MIQDERAFRLHPTIFLPFRCLGQALMVWQSKLCQNEGNTQNRYDD